MESFSTPAVVVRVVDYGEADRILTLLTRTSGKVSAMARGARRSRRRFGAALGMFAVGEARLQDRRGAQLAILEGWDPIADHSGLAVDLARMAHAGYVCEAARELSAARHADPEVFDLVIEMLEVLSDTSKPARAETLRVFELRLLDAVGLGPVLDWCLACGGELDDEKDGATRFDLGRGGVVCGACHGVGPELGATARRLLLRARGLGPRNAVEELELPASDNAQCRDVLVAAIHHHIGRPLRSVEFIAKVNGV